MLKRILHVIAAVAIVVPLAACDFDATGTLVCNEGPGGVVTCEADSTYTPGTLPSTPVQPTPDPPVDPPTTDNPPPPTNPPGPPVTLEPTPPPSTSTPPTTNPPPVQYTEAALRYGWGSLIPAGSDEFNYVGAPSSSKWELPGECWAGHGGNGQRCASNSVVDGNKLVQTGEANGDSAWLASKYGTQYGRWEARVKSYGTAPNNGRQYHPLLIIWPDSDLWPDHGEYDFLENGAPGQACAEAFLHYPHPDGEVQQEHAQETNCGDSLSGWHNVAFEWTINGVAGYIDGQQWFRYNDGAGPGGRSDIQDMPSGHLTIQLDNFFGGNMQTANYEVDWVRAYAA